ncbi:MAG: 16S rRNA (guanine(966)-N(2))-methyltransferase RsmD, partial [Candidatus Omnitrophica bacterium]|nr:16S rRNA (guanine(966)-N(2))-methyltransferase RsmD [Candidatus Omnitrophota bacterium]
MKILLGKLRGRNFYMPAEIRPTQNMVRKAIFDILGHDLSGIHFLDLFAGSGAVGLEALSLGAEKVTFVEKTPLCLKVIEENLRLLGVLNAPDFQGKFEVISGDGLASIKEFARQERRFDVIFIDPPYQRGLGKKALKTLGAHVIVGPNCTVLIEHSLEDSLPEAEGQIQRIKERRYGNSSLSIY